MEEFLMEIIVGGIIEKDGYILLVQEAKEKCRGKWNIPAGHLENSESIIEGAIREIKEECGCDVEINGILKIGNIVLKDNNVILIVFATKLISNNIVYNKDEILDVKWFSYDEIINMKNELRESEWLISVIKSYKDNKILDIDYIKIF